MAQGNRKMNPNDFYNRNMTYLRSIQNLVNDQPQDAAEMSRLLRLQQDIQNQKLRIATLSDAVQTRKKYESENIVDAEFEIINEEKV